MQIVLVTMRSAIEFEYVAVIGNVRVLGYLYNMYTCIGALPYGTK